jgi:hypothetical protein
MAAAKPEGRPMIEWSPPHRGVVASLLLWPEYLTQWEREFLASLAQRWDDPTPKQQQVLAQLVRKVDQTTMLRTRPRRRG